MVLLFAYSTIVSWSYYGLKGWQYLFGDHVVGTHTFHSIYCLFIILGCALPVRSIIEFTDAALFLLCIPNLLGLYFLAPQLKKELPAALARMKKNLK